MIIMCSQKAHGKVKTSCYVKFEISNHHCILCTCISRNQNSSFAKPIELETNSKIAQILAYLDFLNLSKSSVDLIAPKKKRR